MKPTDVVMYDRELGFHITSWCPSPTPTVPPTQVHLHVQLAGGEWVLRFKSPKTLDLLIAALEDHRRGVWGERR